MQKLFRAASLSTLLLLANCTSSNSETVDEIVDDSSDNQISSVTNEEPASPDIPSPEQVSEESAAAAALDAAEGTTANTDASIQDLPADQQAVGTINQVDDTHVNSLSGTLPQQASPDVPPPPSLSEIVGNQEPMGAANEASDVLSPMADEAPRKAKGKTKRSKSSRPMSHEVSNEQPIGDQKVYIVQPGDTLGTISRVVYGSRKLWRSLASLNNLDENSKIFPGDAIKYNADKNTMSFESEWENLPQSTVTVRSSDTLSAIAARVMGNPAYWKLLWRWNESVVSNPHRISPGSTLKYVKQEDLSAFLTERKSRGLAH